MVELAEGLSLGTRFRLIACLAEGGMSEVWLAHDAERGQDIALKILNQDLARQPGFIELLRAECSKAGQLRHPNIVRVYAVHSEAGLHFIAMEYIAGPSLKGLRGADWQTVLKTLLPLTDALEYAHNAGIVHRDIKPANIVLDSAGNPRLTDFGVASLLAASHADQIRTGGSLPSMSPQQAEGLSPGIGDDVYAFGALIFDLINGAPLFHPDVSHEKVLREIPPRLTEAARQDIPPALDDLVAAMLEKEPSRRPVGMSAVRAALTEILANEPALTDKTAAAPGSIPVVARRGSQGSESADTFQPRKLANNVAGKGQPAGKLNRMLYAGLGLLVLIALAVVFLLPGYIQEQKLSRPSIEPAPEPAAEISTTNDVPEDTGSRQVADQALADLLQLEDRLAAKAVKLWGGAAWAAASAVIAEGDTLYKDRLFGGATDAYRQALRLLEPLESRAETVLSAAIEDGTIALDTGDQKLALERFDLALAIDKSNPAAKAGQARALQLDKVLALMDEASGYELAENWSAALIAYEQALQTDSQWSAASEGRERVSAILSANVYQAAMSSGYAALAAEKFPEARRAFKQALETRPGDRDAQTAIAQIDSEQRLARIISLSAAAEKLQLAEDWGAAIKEYEAILAIDPTVLAAKTGLEQSRGRAELDQRLRASIADPDRLLDDAVWQPTQALLEYARGVAAAGPVLTGQIKELDRLLQRALVPVAVQFESDNLTDVVIYKVGRLGTFESRSVNLRPGTYTAVGVRNGYRDVRQTFRVAPEVAMQPVVLKCENPI